MNKLKGISAIALAFMIVEPAAAQSTELTAEFLRGAIAEYSGTNSNRTSNAVLFDGMDTAFGSTDINSITISQTTDTGAWGGSGNNLAVTAKITYVDGSTLLFAASLAWVKNSGGGGYDWIGVTTAANQNDGYTLSDPSLNKTYVIQFPQSSLDLSTLLPDSVDGSQNSGATLNALNQYFPGPGSSSLTFTSSNAFSYLENSGDTDVIGTVQTANATGSVTYSIITGNDNGWYEINSSTGEISLTPVGVAAAVPNDFETTPNSRSVTVQADDGSSVVFQTIALSETDVDEVVPVITSAASFDVNEGETTVATLTANEAVTWSISGGVDAGALSIDPNTGALTFDVAPDFEAPGDTDGNNDYVIEVTATDASGNTSVQTVTVNVLDVADANTAPSFTGTNATDGGGNPSYAFSYAEGQAEGDALGQVAASDPDSGDTITFSLTGGNADGWFQIDGSSGEISLTAAGVAAAANDFEGTPNAHTLTVTASDGTDTTAIEVVLNETDVDEVVPVITSAASFDVNEGETTVATLTANEAVTWSISGGVDAGALSIDPNTGALTFDVAPDFEAPGDTDGNNDYVIEVTATDASGNTSVQTVTVNVLDVADANTAPSFTGTNATDGGGNPSYAFSYAEGQAEGDALGQVAASDPDSGDTITFSLTGGNADGWFQIDGSSGEISLTAAGVAAAANDFEGTPNAHTLTVTASDGTDTTAIEVVLNETDVDEVVPVITSAASFDVNEGETTVATLTANEAVTWSISGGVDAGALSIDPNTGALTFDVAPDFEAPGDTDGNNDYVIEVTATDASGNTSVQTVTVNVLDVADANTAPSFTGTNATDGGGNPSYAFSYAEGQAEGDALGQVAASDPDSGDTITFSLTGGNADGWFQIDGSSGEISLTAAGVAAAANDFEGTPNAHTLTVTASDGTDTTAIEVVLNETDVDEVVPVITSAASFDVNEGETTVATLTANEAVTWSISGGVDAGALSIDPNTGALTFDVAPDFEAPGDTDGNNDYVIEVTATDASGNTSVQTVTVNVLDVADANTAPSFTGTNATDGGGNPSYAFSYAEGQAEGDALGQVAASDPDSGDTITFSLTGGNADGWFQIDGSSGEISLTAAGVAAAANDFEGTPNAHTLTVTASDGTDTTAIEVVLNETDVDEVVPVITSAASFDVNEGETTVATLTANEAVTWSISGGVDAGALSIDPNTGALTFDVAPDFEAPGDTDGNNDYVIEVTATDASGNTSVQTVTVNVLDVADANTAPSFTGTNATDGGGNPSYAFSYAEGQAEGDALGQVAASDPDSGDTITFSLTGGNADGWFQIDGSSGEISLTAAGVAAAANDFEGTPNAHTLTVTASDGTDTTAIEVVLNETDVDEGAPVISGPSGGAGAGNADITVDEGSSTVTQLTSNEPVTWSIAGGNDQGLFTIAPDGTISFTSPPDFENPTDSDGNNTYILTVEAEDADGNVSSQTITVTIADVDEGAPVISGPSGGAGAGNADITVDEGSSTVIQLTSNEPVTWSIAGGNDQGLFTIAPDGTISFTSPPDFENPTDSDGNNTYILTVEAEDADGNVSSQTITVTIADVDEGAPVISGPSGGAGAGNADITVDEGSSTVIQLTSNEPVTWSIAGGNDQGLFTIAPDGTISFTSPPDFENPTDSDGNNTYILTVEAEDADGNVSSQTITVTIADVDEGAPVISGPSGGAGAGNADITVDEGSSTVIQLTSNEPVTWSIAGGNDQGLFTIAPDGTISFTSPPDFENPTDSDGNNTYILTVEAEDADGNVSSQTITVTIADVDEGAPVISGPSGGAGAGNADITVDEGSSTVIQLTSNEPVTWSIAGGNDQGLFTIAPDGTISFTSPPDFENPTDSDGNNTYILTVEAEDADGNVSSQTITVTIADVDEGAPVISGPSGGAGAGNADITVDEGSSTVIQLTSNEPVTWSIAGGNDQGLFTIAPDGTISFTSPPDFENPTDSDGNNTYILTVEAEDADGNVSSQTITVTIADVDEGAPVISGPSGGAGAGNADITVDEGSSTVIQLTSNEPVTWSIAGGNDQGLFTIAPDGTISFTSPPDFENPTDSDGNNTYILTVEAEDADGNVSSQTITVTIADVDEGAPVISSADLSMTEDGASIEVTEGNADVADFDSDEAVSWSIAEGNDGSQFSISDDGKLKFVATPDFEAPIDLDRNNIYVLAIEATDGNGNVSRVLIDVTVLNFEELQERVTQISAALKQGLRTHALVGLSDLLSYNEGLMIGAFDCSEDQMASDVSGAMNANEDTQHADVRFQDALTACGKSLRILVDGGATVSRLDGNSRVRGFASVRLEKNLTDDARLGLNLIGSTAADRIDGFTDSDISDFGLTGQIYGRVRFDEKLMAGAFVGYGQSRYSFNLDENGLEVDGDFTGKRFIVGGMMRGELALGDRPLTIDAVLSHAAESLGKARFDSSLDEESSTDLSLGLGRITQTRLSVPLTYTVLSPGEEASSGIGLDLSAGGLCESDFFGPGLGCGFQAGGRLYRQTIAGSYAYLDLDVENAAGLSRFRVDAGYAFDIGLGDGANIALNVATIGADRNPLEVKALVTLKAKR